MSDYEKTDADRMIQAMEDSQGDLRDLCEPLERIADALEKLVSLLSPPEGG